MRLYYYLDPQGNFGDDLNPWLWRRVLPDCFDGYRYHQKGDSDEVGSDAHDLFVGVGTLLNEHVPSQPRKAVMGAGMGYGAPPRLDDRWRFYCVRGPHTARRLGLDESIAVTDGAALCGRLLQRQGNVTHAFGFIPHHHTAGTGYWKSVCDAAGVRYIDPRASVPTVLDGLQACEVVIAEAMHGAIVSDALGIPWVAVATNPIVLPFKWVDWCASLGLEYRARKLPSLWLPFEQARWPSKGRKWLKFYMALRALRKVCATAKPQLSDRAVLAERTDELLVRIERFKADFAAGSYR